MGNQIRLGPDRALFLGHLPATHFHRHAAPVFLLGLSGDLEVRFEDGRHYRGRSALIDSDVMHALDSRGEQMASIYLEPDAPEVPLLRKNLLQGEQAVFELTAPQPARGRLERRLMNFDLSSLLQVPLAPSASGGLDPRIRKSLPVLRSGNPGAVLRAQAADQASLSESRFNHLFRAEMGISFRRYRSWSLMRNALYRLGQTTSLTDAALEAGFCDSAHFSRVFRDLIGLTPSSVFRELAAFEVVSG